MQVEMFVEMFEMEIVQQKGMSGTRLVSRVTSLESAARSHGLHPGVRM